MNTTSLLAKEHYLIEQVLNYLERTAEGCSRLDAIKAAINPPSAAAAALSGFTEHARAYIGPLLAYVARQQDCVFPMIAQIPPHADKKPNGTHGIPHLAAVSAREIKVEPPPSPFEGMKAIGRVRPRPSKVIEASPLSVGFETLDRRMFHPERTYEHLAKLGVKWARVQTGWARTEAVKGTYDFAWLDGVVDSLRRIGIQPWLTWSTRNLSRSSSDIPSTSMDTGAFPCRASLAAATTIL